MDAGGMKENIYFCRSFYDWHFNIMGPLEIAPEMYFMFLQEPRSLPEKRVFLTTIQLNHISSELMKHRFGERTAPPSWPENIQYTNLLDFDSISTPYRSMVCPGTSSSMLEIRKILHSKHPAYKEYGLFAKQVFSGSHSIRT